MTIEYGIFNDEGLVEGQFYSEATARQALTDRYADDPHATVAEACPDHPENPAFGCEDCDR